MFLDKHFLKRCLFVDIETVSEVANFEMLTEVKKDLWSMKADQLRRFSAASDPGLDDAALFAAKAGIFAEFSKVVCISMGFLHFEGEDPVSLRIKSLAGDDEHRILEDFNRILVNHYNDPENSRRVGLALAEGKSLSQILEELGHVAEGVYTAREVDQLATDLAVDMPISAAVAAVLDGRLSAAQALAQLMSRDPREEIL